MARRAATTPSTYCVELRNVHKSFGTRSQVVHALRGVSVAIPRRTFVAVMGPSGSGQEHVPALCRGTGPPDVG